MTIDEAFSKYVVKPEPSYLAEQRKWRSEERPHLRVVRCAKGGKIGGERAHVYVHSLAGGVLGYAGRGMRLRKRLLGISGVRSWQVGDEEFSVVFPARLLDAVAKVVNPRKRRAAAVAEMATSGA
jgi:hypothetical protein